MSEHSEPWYRSPDEVMRIGRRPFLFGTGLLAFWAVTAGTWRAITTVFGTVANGTAIDATKIKVLTGYDWLTVIGGAIFYSAGALGVAALILLATGLLGGAFGFLFGLPRMGAAPARIGATAPDQEQGTNQTPPQGTPREEDQQRRRNSGFSMSPALNEIADWLTKIIVGLGLVQAREIGGAFWAVMRFFLDDGGLGRFPAAGVVVPACMVIGLIGGFVIFYLVMTLSIGPDLAAAANDLQTPGEKRALAREEKAKREAAESRKQAEEALLARDVAQRQKAEEAERATARMKLVDEWRRRDMAELLQPRPEADRTPPTTELNAFARTPLADLATEDERRAWAKANIAIGRRKEAMEAYQKLTENSTNFTLLQEAYKLAVVLRNREVAAAVAAQIMGLTPAQVRAASDTAREQYAFARVNEALYRPNGYTEALRILDEMKEQTPGIEKSGTWNVLRAAALGQQFAKEQRAGKNVADMQDIVDQAIAAISAGMGKHADWLRSLADPDHPTKQSVAVEDRDDDLVLLARSVPEVSKALGLT